MSFRYLVLLFLSMGISSGVAYARNCPETVDGQSMAELMAEEGGAEALRELSLDFVAAGEAMLETLHDELDRSGSDHRRAQEILAEMAKVQSTQETDFKIAQAASCYLGG